VATKNEMAELAAKAVASEDFRVRLFRDPTAVAFELGITLTDEQVGSIHATDIEAFEKFVSESDRRPKLTAAWGDGGLWYRQHGLDDGQPA
jgi:hypothetical protein